MKAERLPVREALFSFEAREPLRAALFLTYSFDGRWFEEAIVPDLCERPIETMLVIRDRNAISSEARSVRYRRANACQSAVFHPKLTLLVTDEKARAVIGSANLTRGGFERHAELGRVFDLGPSELADLGLFTTLVEYLAHGVAREVKGNSARDLAKVTDALREVVKQCKGAAKKGDGAPPAAAHVLLHNYDQPIWMQLIGRMPHRVLRRAVIVSPFFEPDRTHPEDPAVAPRDASIFERLLRKDFEFDMPKDEAPVRVFFRQSQGRTELPVTKLAEFGDKLAYFAQDEREPRLHAKLLLLEGAATQGREPFLFALHGSPNFTTAGLINRPPGGNSELAVLTMLPAKRKSLGQCLDILGLEHGFTRFEDLGGLQMEPAGEPPRLPSQGVADTTYRLADGTLKISLLRATPAGARIRVLLERDGSWFSIGETDASELTEVLMPVTGIAETDGRTKLFELRGTTVRVEIVAADGTVLVSDSSPVNVDRPEEFCGLTLVGPVLLTLDERIARAGIGAPPTYREQQKWVETCKAQKAASAGTSVAHQADLDRFYRNIHQGLRGKFRRARASAGQEYSLRRALHELVDWGVEAVTSDDPGMTRECRLFLIARLFRGARALIDGSSAAVKARIPGIAAELGLSERLSRIIDWLDRIHEPALATYAADPRVDAHQLLAAFRNGGVR